MGPSMLRSDLAVSSLARQPVRQKIAKRIIEAFCADVDVRLNGSRPRDPIILDDRFFSRVLSEGSLGLGESYMLGWWGL